MEPMNTATDYNGSGNFPERLHYVLEEMARGQEHIMCWNESGTGFIVHDRKLLETEILPTWFRQTRFTSFQRQLNIYSFATINSGPNKGTYYHALFVRNMPELAQTIPRKDIKNKKNLPNQTKTDYGNLDTVASEPVAYHESQEILPRRMSPDLLRRHSSQSVPPALMSNVSRSAALNPLNFCTHSQIARLMNSSHPGGSILGPSLSTSSHRLVPQPFQVGAIIGQDLADESSRGNAHASASSQELINKALSLIRSNNGRGS